MTKKKKQDSIWYSSDAAEKVRIREFWLQLSEEDRKSLVKLEKEAVLKKMKEQQRSNCSCNVCGRKKSVIEEELEILYDAYYEELEHFANDQKKKSTDDVKSSGILHVADDFLKNDGQKFLCLMEELAAQRLRVMEEDVDKEGVESDEEDWDDVYDEDDDDSYDEDDEIESIGEQQRMEEGRRMFQIFAAKMFEQRVLTAYREKVAQERQRRLLEELEEEERAKEGAKLEKEKKKAAKKALKKQKEEERQRNLEKEKLESSLKEQQENALKEAEKRKLEEEEEKEKARLLELKKQEEAEKKLLAKQEAERKAQLQKKAAKEQLLQKKKAQEQLLQKEREQAKLRIQKEAEEKAKEDRKREKDEKIKAAKRERKERKARERLERESSNSTLRSATSEKGSSSSLHLSSIESESAPHSPSLKDLSYNLHKNHPFRVDNSIHPQKIGKSFAIQKAPLHSDSHQVPSNQQSTKNPPGLSPTLPLDPGVAFSPLSYGLSLQSQDMNARAPPVHSPLNPLGFMGQHNPIQSLSGMPVPISRKPAPPIHRSQNRPPGIQEPELSALYVDEAATLRLSGLYEEADELISGSPSASNELLSGIHKAPSSNWNSLMGTSSHLGSNPLPTPHIGLESLWTQHNPSLSASTNARPSALPPPYGMTHQQFVQMQSSGSFSAPPSHPGFSGISQMSMAAIPGNQPVGQTDGASAWPTNRFFDTTL